jgi:hypothetical protein
MRQTGRPPAGVHGFPPGSVWQGTAGVVPPLSTPLLASSVLSAKYRRNCAPGIGDPRAYLSHDKEIVTLSLLCDRDSRATTDDQSSDVGPYVLVASCFRFSRPVRIVAWLCGAVKPATVRWSTVIKITIAHVGPALDS